MNKIMNKPEDYEREVASGFIRAYGEHLLFPNGDLSSVILRKSPETAQTVCVGICDGGHMPVFAGYVKPKMLNACCIGPIFKSPKVTDIIQTVKKVDMGKGVILIPMIFNEEINQTVNTALELLKKDGMNVDVAEIRDDCMQPKNDESIRLTSAGVFLACVIAGGACWDKKEKDDVLSLLKRVNQNMRSAANVGGSFYLPNSNQPFMKIDDGKMQIGVGLHGEEGFEMVDFPSAYLTAEHLFRHRINKELNIQPNEEVVLLINDLGSATIDEMLIVYQEEANQFELKGAKIIRSYIGRYVTTLDMDGVCITALRVDETMKKYIVTSEDICTH